MVGRRQHLRPREIGRAARRLPWPFAYLIKKKIKKGFAMDGATYYGVYLSGLAADKAH